MDPTPESSPEYDFILFFSFLNDTPTPTLSPTGAGTTVGAGSIAGIGSFES